MKTTSNKIYTIFTSLLLVAAMAGCGGCGENGGTTPEPPEPPVEVDRSNMFGMQEQPSLGNNIGGQSDAAVTKEMVADLCEAMGVKSYRMLMHLHWVVEFDDTGKLRLRDDNVQRFRDYVDLMYDKGIVKLLFCNASYMYPYGHTRTHWRAVPEPGTDLYIEFLEMIEETYKLIAGAFPDVDYFEVGNENNAPNGHNMCKNGFVPGATAEENAPYIFTDSEIARISADIAYYAGRGVRSVNSDGKIVSQGLYMMYEQDTKDHIKSTYEHILSGNMPSTRWNESGGRVLPADKNPGNYFDYLNLHPYIHEGHTLKWLSYIESLYRIAVDHGDAGRKIMVTEFGYFDSYLERREELIADVCVPAIVALTDRVKTIEAVFIFRMFNWVTAGTEIAAAEQTYGIFDSPSQAQGARPKPVAISLFYHFNEPRANSDPLFQYMK